MDKFSKVVTEMKDLATQLMPQSFPKQSGSSEDAIRPLKLRNMVIDGYEVVIYFSRSEYPTHIYETFQIYGQKMPFLPFHFVLNTAKRFLGERHLSFVELFVSNRKLYIWTRTVDHNGKVMAVTMDDVKEDSYDGVKFTRLNPSNVNFL